MNEPIDQAARHRFSSELDRNFSVVASAGSGKTRAITDRIVEIAKDPQTRDQLPDLVVVTFTNRAADEMQQRARQQIFAAGLDADVIAKFNRAFFGTIHSFCLRLLDDYGYHLGLPAKLEFIADDEDLWNEFVQRQTTIGASLAPDDRAKLLRHIQVRHLMELGRRSNLGAVPPRPLPSFPKIDLSALLAFAPDGRSFDTITGLQAELAEWEMAFRDGRDFLPVPRCTTSAAEFLAEWRSVFDPLRKWLNGAALHVAAEVERAYRALRLEKGALTYDDQIAFAQALLAHPEAALRIREKNHRVILDEAQDTDAQQFSILLEVTRPPDASGLWPSEGAEPPRPGHFCMVGDFQQSIFGDRADLTNYRRIHKALIESDTAGAVEFSVTFRLDRQEVDLINGTFREILTGGEEQVQFVELNPRPEVLPGQVVRLDLGAAIIQPGGVKLAEPEKADLIATELARWVRQADLKGLRAESWREVAILCPRKNWLRTLREAFHREKFEVEVQSEWELKGDSPAYAWLAALATIMADPMNSYEIVGVLREVFGISDHDLAVFSASDPRRFQIERLSTGKYAVAEALNLLTTTRIELQGLPLFTAISRVVEAVHLRDRVLSLPAEDFDNQATELDALLVSAAAAEANGSTFAEFAETLRVNFSERREIQRSERDAIQLITGQKAKGSEWQAVIIPFLSRQIRTRSGNYPRILKTPSSDEMLVAFDSEDVGDEIKAASDQAEKEEMERLLYVALTRARHTLVLASEGSAFATATGAMQKRSQLKWLRCATGDCNEAAFASLGSTTTECIETSAYQESEAGRRQSAQVVERLPHLDAKMAKRAQNRAAIFVKKVNPSALLAQREMLVAEEDQPNGRTQIPAPANFDNTATRYGSWWHRLVERLAWEADPRSWNAFFEIEAADSPDPDRSRTEWRTFLEHLSSPSDFRQRVGSKGIAHSEMPFFWSVDSQTCLEGIIDLALFDPEAGKCLIVDWKTNRATAAGDEALRERYRPQLAAYWSAISATTGLTVEAGLFATATGSFVRYDTAELGQEWQRLRSLPADRLRGEIAED